MKNGNFSNFNALVWFISKIWVIFSDLSKFFFVCVYRGSIENSSLPMKEKHENFILTLFLNMSYGLRDVLFLEIHDSCIFTWPWFSIFLSAARGNSIVISWKKLQRRVCCSCIFIVKSFDDIWSMKVFKKWPIDGWIKHFEHSLATLLTLVGFYIVTRQ